MKSFKILFLVILPLSIEAQNWQNICSPGITLFADPSNNVACFRQDSVAPVTGNPLDSIYKSYVAIRQFSGSQVCYDTVFGYVLGSIIYRKANGTFICFNHYGDSIFFETGTALSHSWRLCSLQNSGYLQGTISGIKIDSVCGIPDQVKVITLQAKNSANQNIDHVFNNKQILLSKNYGLTLIYDLVTFPSDTTPWRLIGKSSPPIGLQDFSLQEAYNFDVGDEFHTDFYWGYTYALTDVKTINKILSKYVSVTEDTIVYDIEQCTKGFSAPPPYTSYSHDTISDTIILHKNSFYLRFNKQPQEFSPKTAQYCDMYKKFNSSFNDRPVKRFYQNYAKHNSSLDCWEYHANYPFWDYSNGLGQTRYFNQYPFSGDIVTQDWHLVYYRKGTEIWGTPLASDCWTLTGIKKGPYPDVPRLTISPNPILSSSEVKIIGMKSGESAEIFLYDCIGREIYRVFMDSNPFIFKREGIPDGLYILKVNGKSGNFTLNSKVLIN